MNSLSSLLLSWREVALSTRPLTAVLGNESGDLDSVIGSICLAFFLNQQPNFRLPPAVPVLNFDPHEICLRTDVHKFLQLYDISHELFLTADKSCNNLTSFLDISKCDISLVLFDHNRLITSHSDNGDRVVGIVDHHKDESLYLNTTGSLRIIKEIGSASSIVACLCRDSGIEFPFSSFLSAPIIVDCDNFDFSRNKTTPEDVEVFQWLQTLNKPAIDSAKLYSQLKSWRHDIFCLSMKEILKRDYKSFTGKHFEIGFSSIPCSPSQIELHYPSFRTDCIEFMTERKIEILFLTLASSDNGQHRRDLIVFGENEKLTPLVKTTQKDPIYKKVEETTISKYTCISYSITDTTLSRKKLLPMVRSIL